MRMTNNPQAECVSVPEYRKPEPLWLICGKCPAEFAAGGVSCPPAGTLRSPRGFKNRCIARGLCLTSGLARHSHNNCQSDVTLGSSDDEDLSGRLLGGTLSHSACPG